jgi:hypothetical protein
VFVAFEIDDPVMSTMSSSAAAAGDAAHIVSPTALLVCLNE